MSARAIAVLILLGEALLQLRLNEVVLVVEEKHLDGVLDLELVLFAVPGAV